MIHTPTVRTIVIAFLPIVSLAGLLTEGRLAISQSSSTVLTPSSVVEREIGGQENHIYELRLLAGQFVRVLVEQHTVDVVLTITSPDKQQSLEVNNYPLYEPEAISQIADVSGTYQVKIAAASPAAARAAYQLKVEAMREGTPRDFRFFDGERKFSTATRLWKQGNPVSLPQSAALYEEILPLWREIGERLYEMKTLIFLGVVNERQQKVPRFIELYEQALPIAQELNHRRFEAASLNGIGYGWYFLSEHRKAIEYYKLALTIRQSLGFPRELSQTLTALAQAYTDVGDASLALTSYQQALPHARASQDKSSAAFTLSSMAFLHTRLGEDQRALSLVEESLALWREAGSQYGEAYALNIMGVAYSGLRDSKNAIEFFNQSVTMAQKSGNKTVAAQALNNLGNEYWHLNSIDQAAVAYEQALSSFRDLGLRAEIARTLGNIGLLHVKKGAYERANEFLKAALGGRTSGTYIPADAITLSNMAYSHLVRRTIKHSDEDSRRALALSEEALALCHSYPDKSLQVSVLRGMAEAYLFLNETELALSRINEAITLGEELRSNIGGSEHRILMQPWMTWIYQTQINVLMTLQSKDAASGFDRLAFLASENYRLRSLVEVLSAREIESSQGINAEELMRIRELRLKIEAIENLRMQAYNRKQTEKVVQIDSELRELLRQRDIVDARIRTANPRYAALSAPAPVSLNEIQGSLLDKETVLLEYALSHNNAYLWLVTPDAFKSYRLAAPSEIRQLAGQVLDLLASQNQSSSGESLKKRHARQMRQKGEFDAASRKLSQMILGPVARELGSKRLAIVAEGILQYIPFGVLPVPDDTPGSQSRDTRRQAYLPLISKHEIVILPSATVLSTLRSLKSGRFSPSHKLAILADPVFSSSDERVALSARNSAKPFAALTSAKTAPGTTTSEARIVSDVERSAVDSGIEEFRRLPFSRQEAHAISGLLQPSERFMALDFSADRLLVVGDKLRDYRILHFATHGLLNTRVPALSGLVLSLVDEQGRPHNGFLRLHDIYNLTLNADLVVLSGCQTALGREVSGEGLIGLTRGFMHAGVGRIVASLWKVNDQATAGLMKLFYQRMLKDGQRPAAALRSAQISMWKSEPDRIPYRWGAFVLHGDWR